MRSGDAAALESYVAASQRKWLNTAFRLCNDAEQAQDLVAHAWEKFCVKWPQVHAKGNPNGYMATMLHNAFIDSRRSGRFRFEFSRADLPETPVDDTFVDDLVARDSLAAAWRLLSDEEKVVVSLRVFDGYALTEVTAMMSWSHSTVKRRWDSACMKLRGFYRPEAGTT